MTLIIIALIIGFVCAYYVTFKLDPNATGDVLWDTVANAVSLIAITLIVAFIIVFAPIVLVGLVALVAIILVCVLLMWVRSLFIK